MSGQFKVFFSTDDGTPPKRLVAGEHFRLRADDVQGCCCLRLVPRLNDLLNVGMAFYVIDRMSPRYAGSLREWHRSFRVTLEVSEPNFWNEPQVHSQLTQAMEFLSGDDWNLKFTAGPHYMLSGHLFEELRESVDAVCLSSGGLDSTAGLAIRILEEPSLKVLPVTVRHSSSLASRVRRSLRSLGRTLAVDLPPIVVRTAMVAPTRLAGVEEISQRCRAFLFSAVGGGVAALHGVPAVEVYESGIGAVNLPLMAGMVSSQSTRSSHPRFLSMMSGLISQVAEFPIVFRLPFFDRTKAEVVAGLCRAGLSDLVNSTASCIHYPLRHPRYKQCGICVACLDRRMALFAAGIEEPRDLYRYDLFSTGHAPLPRSARNTINALFVQLYRLADLENGAAFHRTDLNYLHHTEVIAAGESPAALVDLYRRYRSEWLRLIAAGQERGWPWIAGFAPCREAA
jgi:7-cyano-7-deazaguanine synthase in queuosine biosynthesis